MMRALVVASAALAAALPLSAQDGWTEVRFHRVHLRNGNFIDGTLIKQTPKETTLQLKVGTMTIKTDQIERDESGELKVIFVKMRTLNEEPKAPKGGPPKLPFPAPKQPPPKTPETTTTTPPPTPVPAVPAAGTVKQKVDGLLAEIRKTDSDRKYQVAEKFPDAGEGWAPYLASLLETLDEASRTVSTNILKRAKDASVVPIVIPFLTSALPAVRGAAVSILGEMKDTPGIAPRLRPLLTDPDPIVRGSVVATLEMLNDADSFDGITRLLSDKDAAVRTRAVQALRGLAEKNGLKEKFHDLLVDAVRSSKGEPKAEALTALGRSGNKSAWNVVAESLADENPQVRMAALQALANINVGDSIGVIIDRLSQERDPDVLSQITVALRLMKATQAIGPLIEVMSTTNELTLKSSCSRALREITGQNLGVNPDKWREWHQKQPKSNP